MRPATLVAAAVAVLVLATGPVAEARTRTGGGAPIGAPQPSPTPAPASPSLRALKRTLNVGMREAGNYSGAYVVDLTTDQVLFSHAANVPRMPASVEKLYTTTTALARFGADGHLSTTVLGTGRQRATTYRGTLYLRGGGDPTFGSSAFDQRSYGTGATVQALAGNLVAATGMRSFSGSVVADETIFDADRGTPATGNAPSIETEGELSGLVFNRGWATSDGSVYFAHPALEAGQQFVSALKAAGVHVASSVKIRAAATPAGAITLASVASPSMATLVALTNTPSDNFFAEMLAKDLGARFGGAGTTAAGAAVIRAQVARSFGIHPRLNDGSGLSRSDHTTPAQVVTLLSDMRSNAVFTNSLAIAGETGTLADEMNHTYAQGRCRGKTGTLHDASNIAGYCHARDGHTLAYAFLMNGIDPTYAHPIQNRMQVAVARYGG